MKNKKMKEEETKDPTPLLIEVKPRATPPAAEIKTLVGSSLIKSLVKKPLVAKRVSQGKPLPDSSFIKSSVEEPPLPVANFAPKATETKPLRGSIVVEPKMVQRASRHLSLPAEEPPQVVSQMEHKMDNPRQVHKCAEVKPKSPTSSLILIDIESEEDEFVEHTERTTPLSESEKANYQQPREAGVKQKAVFEKVHPIVLEQSNGSGKKKCADSKAEALRKAKQMDERMMRLFCVDYNPGPKKECQQHLKLKNHRRQEAWVEEEGTFDRLANDKHPASERHLEEVHPRGAEVKPKSATSSLILMDIVSEEDEFVENTERTLGDPEKANHQQTLEAGVKQKAAFEKVHPIVLEQSNDSRKKKHEDSKADALQQAKELDERMMRLFCVDYNPGPKKESQQHSNDQEKPKNKGKIRTGPFSWEEKKLKRLNEVKKTPTDLLEEFLRDPNSQFNTQPYL